MDKKKLCAVCGDKPVFYDPVVARNFCSIPHRWRAYTHYTFSFDPPEGADIWKIGRLLGDAIHYYAMHI